MKKRVTRIATYRVISALGVADVVGFDAMDAAVDVAKRNGLPYTVTAMGFVEVSK